ncbi:hypothetical protein Tco_0993586 [Tanacetum coccineum]
MRRIHFHQIRRIQLSVQYSVFIQKINTTYPLPLDTAYRPSDKFKKLKDLKVEDVSLTCDTSLEVFNNEFNRLSRMNDDLFTYEVEVSNIPCDSNMDDDSEYEADDDMGYDPSDVAFTEWLGIEETMKITNEESSDNKDDVAEVFRIETNIFDYETPLCLAFNEFNYLLKVDPDLLTKDIMRIWKEPTLVKHHCKPFNYKTGCSEWPTCSWTKDGYCNEGNLLGIYVIGNSLHYQDLKWYEALEDSELKEEALRNKANIGRLSKRLDDESRYEQRR